MASKVKHLKDSFVVYMYPIQKAPAGNTAESAIHAGFTIVFSI